MRNTALMLAMAALYAAPLYAAGQAAAPAAPQPIYAELNDRSKIQIDPGGTVWVLEEAGQKVPAPDGTLTLKDGTPFVVKDGHMVTGE